MKISKKQYNGLPEDLKKHFINGNFHPTTKSIKLMSYLITLGSRKGDVIFDPFAGSGTTGIACTMLGRDFIMIEKEKEYCKIAEARIKEERRQLKLFD